MRAAFQGKEPQICAKECTIEKIIVLPVQQYEKFTKNLLQRYDFIAENLNLMGISGDTWNCILVTARGVQEGVLVQSDGADYARYASLIPILTEDMIQECSGAEELTEETLHQQIF